MTMESESATEIAEAAPETAGEYGLHIRLAREIQPVLRNAADLAYQMGLIPKPGLVSLMNLFIGWGMSIQKKKWLDQMGYK